jgi:1,4-dihydroxy-2-naphthoate octaprenyltransferase
VKDVLATLGERFSHAVIVYVGEDGYPVSVATEFEADAERGVVELRAVADELQPPLDDRISVVFSHIRPQPGVGYDERRYVSLWGKVTRGEDGYVLTPERELGWDEEDVPFFEYSERSLPQAKRYYERVSREQGREVKPQLSRGWLFLRATRLPFLSATIVPILLGTAVAGLDKGFNWWVFLLTLVGGCVVHLAINVFNDVYDFQSGADEANVTPTQFSGGSRVILYGLLSERTMAMLAWGFYALGLAIGIVLAATRGWDLLWLGVAGLLVGFFYTAPPLRLVHRGLGEVAVFAGFGPIMTLGAYFVQAREYAWAPFLISIPVGILIALVLYVNEVPDRPGDAAADKRTLPVRFSKRAIINGYIASVAAAFAVILVLPFLDVTPWPTLIALLAVPLALPVVRALRDAYDKPYVLMPAMGKNIQLHLVTGLLLIAGYVIAIVADAAFDDPPSFLS